MIVSYNWLAKLVDLQGIDAHTVADRLTNAGLEVEGLEPLISASGLVIGHVLRCTDHPNSDHLHVTQVDVGSEILSIVCGAPNVAAGQKVVVALTGAKLPGGQIKESVIRGQASHGMICSLQELGLAEKFVPDEFRHGIVILDEDAPVGGDPLAYLHLSDWLLDVRPTPNRADFQSMWAIAREVGAIFDRAVHLPELKEDVATLPCRFQVGSATTKCSRFLGRVIHRVRIGESPQWLRDILISSGIKPINNLVDISNLVMLETGQPLHFYDLRMLPDHELVVREDMEGDYEALDGTIYHLAKQDALITSGGRPVGIAGIMGLGNTMIREDTVSIVIEAASFDRVAIRKTARRLNLMTEASQRFSKPMDPLACNKAMQRALDLLVMLADAQEIEALASYDTSIYEPLTITTSAQRISQDLGITVDQQDVLDVFRRLNFAPRLLPEGLIEVSVPSYRTGDLSLPIDLTEEVIRILGYERIGSTLPLLPQTIGSLTVDQQRERLIERSCLDLGLHQTLTYGLISHEQADHPLAAGDAYALLSPLSEDRSMMRNQLMSSLVRMLGYNQARQNEDGWYFEIGDVYAKQGVRRKHLAIIGQGRLSPAQWDSDTRMPDFYTLKGMVLRIFADLGIPETQVELDVQMLPEGFHPYRSCWLNIEGIRIGILGQIHPEAAQKDGLREAYYAEMDLDALAQVTTEPIHYEPISRFPSVRRDLSLVISDQVVIGELLADLKRVGKPTVRQVILKDVFRSAQIGADRASMTISVVLNDPQKTLTDEQIQATVDRLIRLCEHKYQAELRA